MSYQTLWADMTDGLWIMLISRILICICAGEVAIRYAGWTWTLLRRRENSPALLIIPGVMLWAASRFGVEFRWMTLMGNIRVNQIPSLVENDGSSELFRIGIIIALCFLTYPVTQVEHKTWEKALVEMAVRVFLITVSSIAGYMICLVRLHYLG